MAQQGGADAETKVSWAYPENSNCPLGAAEGESVGAGLSLNRVTLAALGRLALRRKGGSLDLAGPPADTRLSLDCETGS